jgi:hypothetical protein
MAAANTLLTDILERDLLVYADEPARGLRHFSAFSDAPDEIADIELVQFVTDDWQSRVYAAIATIDADELEWYQVSDYTIHDAHTSLPDGELMALGVQVHPRKLIRLWHDHLQVLYQSRDEAAALSRRMGEEETITNLHTHLGACIVGPLYSASIRDPIATRSVQVAALESLSALKGIRALHSLENDELDAYLQETRKEIESGECHPASKRWEITHELAYLALKT